jgi:hypothetical protein
MNAARCPVVFNMGVPSYGSVKDGEGAIAGTVFIFCKKRTKTRRNNRGTKNSKNRKDKKGPRSLFFVSPGAIG